MRFVMEKEKVIIFGMGSTFRDIKNYINEKYDVIGFCSNDSSQKKQYSPFYLPEDLLKQKFDRILICSVHEIDIFNQLIEVGISSEKICLCKLEMDKRFSYSQSGEDIVLLFLLNELEVKTSNAHYIELGTCHPVYLNNTYALYKQGARGIIVEPSRRMKNIIKKYRPDDLFLNVAVDKKAGTAKYYELSTQELGTISYDSLDLEYCNGITDFDLKCEYDVETMTVNQIFELLDAVVDVLSIDIEGMDYEVLKELDWELYCPRIVVAELYEWGAKEQKDSKIIELMESQGYELIHRYESNGFFVFENDAKKLYKYFL